MTLEKSKEDLLRSLIVSLCKDGMKGTELFPRIVAETYLDGGYSKLAGLCTDELYEGLENSVLKGDIIKIEYCVPGGTMRDLYFPSGTAFGKDCQALIWSPVPANRHG